MSDHFIDKFGDTIPAAIDLSVLNSLQRIRGDHEPDLVVELIDLYLEETPRRLASMSVHLEERDVPSLRRTAHNLKGSSAAMGAAGTAGLCKAVEETIQNGPRETVANLLTKLQQESARVREAFLAERYRRTREARECAG